MARNTALVASEPSAEMVASSTARPSASPAGLADIRSWAAGRPPTKPWTSSSGVGFGMCLGRRTRKGGWIRPPYSGEPKAGSALATCVPSMKTSSCSQLLAIIAVGDGAGTAPPASQKNTGMMTGRTPGSPCVW